MCKFCDERGLPCLMCGRACMTYNFDRTRRGRCAHGKRPPAEFPVFKFCPYCGRQLNEETSQNQEKEKDEEDDMEVYEWTDEKVERLKELVRAGRSRTELAAVFGCNSKCIDNKLTSLRKKDPTLPGGHRKKGNAEAEPSTAPEKEGELNELEQTLAEVVTELQGENDKLKGDFQALYEKCEEQNQTINTLREELQIANTKVRELQSELANTLNAMSTTETQLDEERQAREAAEAQAANDEYIAIYRQMSDEIERLTAENRRQNNITMGIIEKFLLAPSPEVK